MIDCFTNLQWLDLQSNYLKTLDPCILKLTNIKTLYIQDNYISNMEEIQKLHSLPKLRNLSLHSNPLTNIPDFRLFSIALLPEIRKIDSVLVTHKERDNALFISSVYNKKRLPMYDGEDLREPPSEVLVTQNNNVTENSK